MGAPCIHELAIAAQQASSHAAGAAEAADRGWADSGDARHALDAAQACRRELADSLAALARDAPAEHARLLARLRQSLLAHAFEASDMTSRASAWLDAGAPPEHRDAAWAIVWLLGSGP